MRSHLMNHAKRSATWVSIPLLMIFLWGTSAAAGGFGVTAALKAPPGRQVNDHSADLRKILSVVGSRTNNDTILEKAKEKLGGLSEGDIRLAASLCDRIARDDDAAGADIAFSLVTALIVLS